MLIDLSKYQNVGGSQGDKLWAFWSDIAESNLSPEEKTKWIASFYDTVDKSMCYWEPEIEVISCDDALPNLLLKIKWADDTTMILDYNDDRNLFSLSGRRISNANLAHILKRPIAYIYGIVDLFSATYSSLKREYKKINTNHLIGRQKIIEYKEKNAKDAERIIKDKENKLKNMQAVWCSANCADSLTQSNMPDCIKGLRGLVEFVFPGPLLFYSGPIIYFLLRDDIVVYVGQSKVGTTRAVSHCDNKNFTRIFILPLPDADANYLNNEERKYINMFLPEYNKDYITKRIKNNRSDNKENEQTNKITTLSL